MMTIGETTLRALTQTRLPRGWSYGHDGKQGQFVTAAGLAIHLRVGDRATQIRCHVQELTLAGDPAVWAGQVKAHHDATGKVPTLLRAIHSAIRKTQHKCLKQTRRPSNPAS